MNPDGKAQGLENLPDSGKLLQRRGPWIGSGEWWDRDSWSREEWDVQLDSGVLYRLVREKHDWLIEGIYG